MENINDITIRPIEERDKPNYLKLFNEESFGCIGIYKELKPTIYEEEKLISNIINKIIIDTNVLVIEKNQEFIGYALITRESKTTYHIGEFVIKSSKRNNGYGKKLLDTIKEYASNDGCNITLECISSSKSFFLSQKFINTYMTNYTYYTKSKISAKTPSLFVDYNLIEEERRKREKQSVKTYIKFLDSPLYKQINDMI